MTTNVPIAVYTKMTENLMRVSNLIQIYQKLSPTSQGRRPVSSTDILRAATVFLHATLEEFMRGLVVDRWPRADAAVLNIVPLVGLNAHGRPEKFALGQLASYRTKTVQEVIDESVQVYAGYLTVNNATDLANLIRQIDIPVELVNARFADLEGLMERRHNIVHQADRNDTPGQGNHSTRSLGVGQVRQWMEAVTEFCESVWNRIPE